MAKKNLGETFVFVKKRNVFIRSTLSGVMQYCLFENKS